MALTIACGGVSNVTPALLTRAEKTAFEETSRYDDVRTFIDALSRETTKARVEMFGKSEEGRDLPLLVIGDPPAAAPVPSPHSLPVVLVMANIHAGEVEGKEAVLHLARRITLRDLLPLAARTALGDGPAVILVGQALAGANRSDRKAESVGVHQRIG